MKKAASGKARRGLCILLGCIVCNYFTSLQYSFDVNVKIDTFTQENQCHCDIGKLLDKMSSCPVVRLRGLATKNRRNKSRTLTRFEVLIWLSMMAFAQLLRSLIAHINALLLRAGDVELNPGPTPPSSPTHDNTEAATGMPSQDTDQPIQSLETNNTLSNPELEPEIPTLPQHQIEAQQATLAHDLSSQRKVIVPDILVPPGMALEPQHFQDQKGGTTSDDLASSHVEHPRPQQSYKFPHLEQREPQSDESVPVKLVVHHNKAKGEESSDDDLMHHRDFGEMRRASSCISLKEFEKIHRKRIEETTVETKTSISDDNNSRITFIIAANRLLRVGKDCEFCPLCFKKKLRTIFSHVVPRALLTAYKRIHCSIIKKQFEDFIYDFSCGVRMGPRALSYPMLCDTCEKLCNEESLMKLYIFLMDKPNKKSFKVPNGDCWLQHVLAHIMFRGLMIADNLPNELQDYSFKQRFKALRNYCTTCKSMPEFYLFLLPNQSIDEELIAFIYPFEYILRSPMFSTVIRDKKIGINFVYTKIDCFHLVLPLDSKSEDYFNHFQKGFDTYEHLGHKYVDLRWTVHGTGVYERKFDRETKAVKYTVSEEVKPCIFPEVLLKVALHQYGRYISMIYSHSEKSALFPHCKIMIEYLPGLNHEYPSKDFSGTTAKDIPQMSIQPGESIEFPKLLTKEQLKTMIENAAKISPLGLQQRKIDEQSAEIERTKNKLLKKSEELKDMKKVMEYFNKAVESAVSREQMERKKRISVERHLTERDTNILFIENELTLYQQRLQVVHSLLSKERRERNRCRLENAELKKQSRTVEKNLNEALGQIFDGLKELQQHTSLELCNKLLHQCQQMITMINKDSEMDAK